MPGIRTSISTTSGSQLARQLERLGAVARLAHDLEAVELEDQPEPRAHQLLVVGEQDGGSQRQARP